MAALSANGRASQAGFASKAASIAAETSDGEALEYDATVDA